MSNLSPGHHLPTVSAGGVCWATLHQGLWELRSGAAETSRREPTGLPNTGRKPGGARNGRRLASTGGLRRLTVCMGLPMLLPSRWRTSSAKDPTTTLAPRQTECLALRISKSRLKPRLRYASETKTRAHRPDLQQFLLNPLDDVLRATPATQHSCASASRGRWP
jgi:hypothetical protein